MTATKGSWSASATFNVPDQIRYDRSGNNSVTDTRGLFVLHAVLLCTGKVLVFCGHVENLDYGGINKVSTDYRGISYVFDLKNPAAQMTPVYFPVGLDLFCCHYVQIPDGRILVVGGSVDFHQHGSQGAKNICFFDPITETWDLSKRGSSVNFLDQGRWYPTAVLLGDGSVVVFSGRDGPPFTFPNISDKVEILSPNNYSASVLTGATFDLPIYPGMHLAPNGKIYFTGTNWGNEINTPPSRSLTVDVAANTGTWNNLGLPGNLKFPRREEGMSVLLPPAQDGKILIIGGSTALDVTDTPSARGGNFTHIADPLDPVRAEILDTKTNTTSPLPNLGKGRINGHCVLLPDETVLILGGHNKYKWFGTADNSTPSLDCEIFDPTKVGTPGGPYTVVAPLNHPRMYHSIAMLLPDGRVLAAGGADPNDREPPLFPGGNYPNTWDAPKYTAASTPLNRKDYEFYQPTYNFKPNNAARPTLTEVQRNGVATAQIYYGTEFKIKTPDAADITKVLLMRPGAPTHHTDSEQRSVRLGAPTAGAGVITVTAPTDKNIAPPGYYMVWIIKPASAPHSGDLPCKEAVFVQLTDPPPAPVPVPSPDDDDDDCIIATTTLGSPNHHMVRYLRELRAELDNYSQAGQRFIQAVNRIYYSFSYQMARQLGKEEEAKKWTRNLVVKPAVALVQLAEKTANLFPTALQKIILILLLTLEGGLFGPVFFLLLAALTTYSFILQKFNSNGRK